MHKESITILPRDHIRGPRDAPLTLLEYGDFECPFSADAYPALRRLLARSDGAVRFVFRHFPITQTHDHALLGAQAAEAAGVQDRFWDMHDLLFESRDLLEAGDVRRAARELELDVKSFEASLADPLLVERIMEDFRDGVRVGVSGTPTFFINGWKYEGPTDGESLHDALFQENGATRW